MDFFCTAGGLNAEMGEGLQEIQDRTGLKRWQVIFGILGEFLFVFFDLFKKVKHVCIYAYMSPSVSILECSKHE